MGCKNCWRHTAKLQKSIICCIMCCGCLNWLWMETKVWLGSPQTAELNAASNTAILTLVSAQTCTLSFHSWHTTGGLVFSFCLCRRSKPKACFSLIGSLPKPSELPTYSECLHLLLTSFSSLSLALFLALFRHYSFCILSLLLFLFKF